MLVEYETFYLSWKAKITKITITN